MRALPAALAVLLACGGEVAQPDAEPLDPAHLFAPGVAPLDAALTFARRGDTVLGVRAVAGESVSAVVLPGARDPLALLEAQGADALRAEIAAGVPEAVPLAELGVPLDLGERHVAGGANFAAHGSEVGVDEPFLFPKWVAPTAWNSDVPGAARLDYEVEVCFVALRALRRPEDAEGALGLLACNDFTDRFALVKGLLRGGEMGTAGFADAKGQPGFLPVGAFLVVPRDLDAFLADVELALWVNGAPRQRGHVRQMVWPWREMLSRAFAQRARDFRYRGGTVRLLADDGSLAARSLLLSGTPEGVIFRATNLWRGSLYLQPGDEVIAQVRWLGALRNRIAARDP
jgi:2-keto-4-pentenoate hydratase/2-oxohepta-3-ene-1,7-dioic acid hydratase in catechol pathway